MDEDKTPLAYSNIILFIYNTLFVPPLVFHTIASLLPSLYPSKGEK